MQRRAFETAAITRYRSRASWDATAVEILAVMLDRWEPPRVRCSRVATPQRSLP